MTTLATTTTRLSNWAHPLLLAAYSLTVVLAFSALG